MTLLVWGYNARILEKDVPVLVYCFIGIVVLTAIVSGILVLRKHMQTKRQAAEFYSQSQKQAERLTERERADLFKKMECRVTEGVIRSIDSYGAEEFNILSYVDLHVQFRDEGQNRWVGVLSRIPAEKENPYRVGDTIDIEYVLRHPGVVRPAPGRVRRRTYKN